MEAGAKPSKPAMRLSRRQANVVEIFVASRQGVQEAKASGVGDKHRSHQTREFRRSSAAVATSREGHRVLHRRWGRGWVSHAMPKEKKRADRRGRPARSGDEL